ncbi:putative capsular polysaccharide synthesis family protein [Alkalimarinus coralli]|uniref:putative capsular polysaccharide synthesis family protein n=1 Tax=Alkalimarinus coralli TaxID=2935863 RepID=UPI00202B6391|nr:putative capsular polysaccharide synthesis family protein [Alkalimarinus coralli]
MNAWTAKLIDTQGDVRKLAEQTYYNARSSFRYFKEARRTHSANGDLFVLAMGKVGSRSLTNSLAAARPQHHLRVDKAHCVCKEGEQYYGQIFERAYGSWDKFPEKHKFLIYKRKAQARYIRNALEKGKNIKIVVPLRDPIATNVSSFFHNFIWWPKELLTICQANAPGCIEKLKAHYLEHHLHDVPLTWFDMELKQVFDIDFLATEFPKDTGYKIYNGKGYEVMIVRLENLNHCATKAFKEFLGLDDFHIVSDNEGKDKWYNSVYKEFKSNVKFPAAYIDMMYNSKWYRHFYSEEELQNFRKRWEETQPLSLVH